MWALPAFSARIPPHGPRKEKDNPHLHHLSASPRRSSYGSPENRFAWDEQSQVGGLSDSAHGSALSSRLLRDALQTKSREDALPHPRPVRFLHVQSISRAACDGPQFDAARREGLGERNGDRSVTDEPQGLPEDMAPEVKLCSPRLHRFASAGNRLCQ